MSNLLTLFFSISTILCSSYQLVKGIKQKNIFCLSLSTTIILILAAKFIALYLLIDLGSYGQFIFIYPLALLCIFKTFKDIELHPHLRRGLFTLFFIVSGIQLFELNKGQEIAELLKFKTSLTRKESNTLNIIFSPQSPFIEEIALVYALRSKLDNTRIFTIPIVTNQYEQFSKIKDRYQFVNVIYVDADEEKIAAGVLEAFLAKDFNFLNLSYKRFEFSKTLFSKTIALPLKVTLYSKK